MQQFFLNYIKFDSSINILMLMSLLVFLTLLEVKIRPRAGMIRNGDLSPRLSNRILNSPGIIINIRKM